MLAAENIDADKPYLYHESGPVADSIEMFEPHVALGSTPGFLGTALMDASAIRRNRDMLLHAASGVGQEIVQRPISDDSHTQCNSMSRVVVPSDRDSDRIRRLRAAMGPSFTTASAASPAPRNCAEAHAMRLRTCGPRGNRAALWNNWARAGSGTPRWVGLYSGGPALLRSGTHLSRVGAGFDETVLDGFLRAASEHHWDTHNDLVFRRSGLIVRLLVSPNIVGSRACADLAITFGTELSRCLLGSRKSQRRLETQLHVISGMAHGAAGFDTALLHLLADIPDDNFLTTTHIAYEQRTSFSTRPNGTGQTSA